MIQNISKNFIDNGGEIVPLIISAELTGGSGITNPSVLIDQEEIILNIRHVGYTLYMCENKQRFQAKWGSDSAPVCYIHPENDVSLRTVNYICKLNPTNLEIIEYQPIDTSTLDTKPVWSFIGLEDVRLVKWEGRLFACGVRRDIKPNGEGRIEMSEIVDGVEINRYRIEPPNDPNSYCEKNWMPIIDKPFHFVKWTNPTEVVKVNIDKRTSKTVYLSESTIPLKRDIRGGSQVIRIGDYYVAITHEVDLWNNVLGKKNAKYYHRFVVWDLDFNIIKYSDQFNFMSADIEFCCGIGIHKEDVLITFGYHDNAAFLLKVPIDHIKEFLSI